MSTSSASPELGPPSDASAEKTALEIAKLKLEVGNLSNREKENAELEKLQVELKRLKHPWREHPFLPYVPHLLTLIVIAINLYATNQSLGVQIAALNEARARSEVQTLGKQKTDLEATIKSLTAEVASLTGDIEKRQGALSAANKDIEKAKADRARLSDENKKLTRDRLLAVFRDRLRMLLADLSMRGCDSNEYARLRSEFFGAGQADANFKRETISEMADSLSKTDDAKHRAMLLSLLHIATNEERWAIQWHVEGVKHAQSKSFQKTRVFLSCVYEMGFNALAQDSKPFGRQLLEAVTGVVLSLWVRGDRDRERAIFMLRGLACPNKRCSKFPDLEFAAVESFLRCTTGFSSYSNPPIHEVTSMPTGPAGCSDERVFPIHPQALLAGVLKSMQKAKTGLLVQDKTQSNLLNSAFLDQGFTLRDMFQPNQSAWNIDPRNPAIQKYVSDYARIIAALTSQAEEIPRLLGPRAREKFLGGNWIFPSDLPIE